MSTEDLIRGLAAEPARPRRATPEREMALALGAALPALCLAVLWLYGARGDIAGYPLTGVGALKVFGGALVAVAAARLAAGMARPGAAARGLAPALGALVAVAAAGVLLPATAPVVAPLGAAAAGALHCVWPVLPLAALPLAASLAALRGGAVTRPAAAGALAGLASGAIAAMAYALWCPADDPMLVALGYGGALSVTAAAGAALGPRALRW